MTWASILQAAGGRKAGNNNHPVQVINLNPKARKRLKLINQEDLTELFSLRLTGTKRIYGVRDRQVLKLLWYDRYHGDNALAVYPVDRNR